MVNCYRIPAVLLMLAITLTSDVVKDKKGPHLGEEGATCTNDSGRGCGVSVLKNVRLNYEELIFC